MNCISCNQVIDTIPAICPPPLGCADGPFCAECLSYSISTTCVCLTCFLLHDTTAPPKNSSIKQEEYKNKGKILKYKVPFDVGRVYTYDDFSHFNVTAIHSPKYSIQIEPFLSSKSILDDDEYLDAPLYTASLVNRYAAFLSLDEHMREARDRESYYIKWSSETVGYGLFARKKIDRDDVIGVYTGTVTPNSPTDDTDYRWIYPTCSTSSEPDCGIDGSKEGNYLRFINHCVKRQNVRVEYCPVEGRWWVLYVALKDIREGQELWTDYGRKYCYSRHFDC